MKTNIFKITLFFLIISIFSNLNGQVLRKGSFKLNEESSPGPAGNAINDILTAGDNIWIGSRDLALTSDFGENWINFTHEDGLGKGSVSAFAHRDGVIWVATAYDTLIGEDYLPAGGGLSYSEDDGTTWHWISQPIDSINETEYSPTTTNIQNLTYDIALTDSAVWIASWGGGLRKSTDMGLTWEVVTVDGLPFDVSNNNFIHMAFAVIYDEEALWVGSAAGIHKSTDGGKTWATYNHQNQSQPISGNFVVSLGHQSADNRQLIWASTWQAVDFDEYRAVSKSEDGGLTWTTVLEGKNVHNFAFDGPIVYAAADEGLYKSLDFGETWAHFPQIIDKETGEGLYTTEFYCVGVQPDSALWAGSSDGLARTLDNGLTWKVFQAYPIPGKGGTPEMYAYPNPFSPLRDHLIGGDGHVRFAYSSEGFRFLTITIKIYDFGMNLVRNLVQNKEPISGEPEVWDGRNDLGDMVANGVYFYQLELNSDKILWGKIMVVN